MKDNISRWHRVLIRLKSVIRTNGVKHLGRPGLPMYKSCQDLARSCKILQKFKNLETSYQELVQDLTLGRILQLRISCFRLGKILYGNTSSTCYFPLHKILSSS